MKKECVNELECRFPMLFKLMWFSIVIWLIASVANYFGHWLLQDKLDSFGMSIIFMFVISLFVCYGTSVIKLIKEHEVLAMDSITKKVASYALIISFAALLIYSMWYYCGGQYEHEETWQRNGAVRSIEVDVVFSIIGNVFKAACVSVVAVLFYWYIRMCFFLFSGRIRRLGIEIALAMAFLGYLVIYTNDQVLINVVVVFIASIFLYDIWRFADFKEEFAIKNWFEKIALEEEETK